MTKKALGRGLPNKLKEREMKTEFQNILEAWRSEGYNVSRLEGILDLDIDSISQAFTLFDNDVKNLRDIAEIVNMMVSEDNESEIESIRSKLKNPDLTAEVLQEVYELDKKIKASRDEVHSEKVEEKIGEWSKELNTGANELMDLWEQSEQEAMVKEPERLQEVSDEVEKKSDSDLENRLSSIKSRLSKLNLDKSIPLRSDKLEESETEAAQAPDQPAEPETPAEAPAPEEAAAEPQITDAQQPPEPAQPEAPSPPPEPSAAVSEPEPEAPAAPAESDTPPPPAVELSPEQQSEVNETIELAKEMYRKQEYKKSIEYFNMALEIDPSNSDAIFFKKRAEQRLQ